MGDLNRVPCRNLDHSVIIFRSKISITHRLYSNTRDNLISELEFNCRENIAFCIKLNRDSLINRAKQKVTPNKYNKIYCRYNQLLFKFMCEKMREFLQLHHGEPADINFECDADCEKFLRDNSLNPHPHKDVHILSDLIAWSNNRGRDPKGVIQLDSTKMIEENLLKKL